MAIGTGITLNDYKGTIRELARPNRFLLTIIKAGTIPATPPQFPFTVRSASLPGRTIGEIGNLFWQGMNYKIAGDPTFDDYTVTFLNSAKFDIKKYFELWLDTISKTIDNNRTSPSDYKATIQVEQLGRGSDVIATYYMHGIFPKSIEPIELSQETVDAVEEFSITFSVDFWSNSDAYDAGEGIVGEGEGTADYA